MNVQSYMIYYMICIYCNWVTTPTNAHKCINVFLCNKNQLNALISQIYFGMKLYMFRTVRLSINRSSFTVHSTMVYVIQVYRQLSSRTRMEQSLQLSTNLYDTHHWWVYSEWTPDDGERHCPKHVEFHAKINLWN
jgi:hypothetical protein